MKVVVPFDPELVEIGNAVADANTPPAGWAASLASLLQGAQALSLVAILALLFLKGVPPLYITAELVAQWAKYFAYAGLTAGLLAVLAKSRVQPNHGSADVLKEFSLETTHEHLVARERNSVFLCSWQDLTKVESDGKRLYVFNVDGRVIVVPATAFLDRKSFDEFHSELASHIAGT